jgi:molybdopterin converting factor small subunit
MSSVRVPAPLRPYAEGLKTVEVEGATVGAALQDLALRYPQLRTHLFDEGGSLRSFVHVFLGEQDVRELSGEATPVRKDDQLLIVPSIAGGANSPSATPRVDHTALRVNQAMIIALLGAAYVGDAAVLVPLTGFVMLLGSALGRPGFAAVYTALRGLRLFRPDVYDDNPEPHRFAQTLGGIVLGVSSAAFLASLPSLGWVLAWVVIALAGLNLFGGFCLGCAVYYWMNRWGVPGFTQTPPPGIAPGRRPTGKV